VQDGLRKLVREVRDLFLQILHCSDRIGHRGTAS